MQFTLKICQLVSDYSKVSNFSMILNFRSCISSLLCDIANPTKFGSTKAKTPLLLFLLTSLSFGRVLAVN